MEEQGVDTPSDTKHRDRGEQIGKGKKGKMEEKEGKEGRREKRKGKEKKEEKGTGHVLKTSSLQEASYSTK